MEELTNISKMNALEKRIAEAFAHLDSIGDQHIMTDAVGPILRGLGCVPSEQEIADFIKATVSDQYEDEIPLSKFTDHLIPQLLENKMRPLPARDLLEAFEELDKEQKGYLTKEELTEAVTKHGEAFSEEEVKNMLKEAVDPMTGFIPYEYYLRKLAYAPKDSIYDMAQNLFNDKLGSLKRKSNWSGS